MRAPRQFHGYGVTILVVPLVAYLSGMAVGDLFEGASYPVTYSLVVGATFLLMAALWRGYACAPLRISLLSVGVGVVGVLVWIGLWWVDRELLGLGSLIGSLVGTPREAFDPFGELGDRPTWMWSFLGIRFAGLVVVVPVIEEFFVRGFLMRYLDAADWDRVPLGTATRISVLGVAAYALLSHPAEPLSAVVWFSMVTWLYTRTRSIWDCVAAHATTNLLLGLYVLGTGTWALW